MSYSYFCFVFRKFKKKVKNIQNPKTLISMQSKRYFHKLESLVMTSINSIFQRKKKNILKVLLVKNFQTPSLSVRSTNQKRMSVGNLIQRLRLVCFYLNKKTFEEKLQTKKNSTPQQISLKKCFNYILLNEFP